MTEPLSPAAQAVLDAWVDQVYDQSGTNAQGLAAALRAAAVYCTRESTLVLMTIAAELEVHQ